jgi:hypothetical protein
MRSMSNAGWCVAMGEEKMAVGCILGDSTFNFSLVEHLEWQTKKEHRRRKHVYFSSAFHFLLFTFESTWTRPEQTKAGSVKRTKHHSY